jgi:hypothetical protein
MPSKLSLILYTFLFSTCIWSGVLTTFPYAKSIEEEEEEVKCFRPRHKWRAGVSKKHQDISGTGQQDTF